MRSTRTSCGSTRPSSISLVADLAPHEAAPTDLGQGFASNPVSEIHRLLCGGSRGVVGSSSLFSTFFAAAWWFVKRAAWLSPTELLCDPARQFPSRLEKWHRRRGFVAGIVNRFVAFRLDATAAIPGQRGSRRILNTWAHGVYVPMRQVGRTARNAACRIDGRCEFRPNMAALDPFQLPDFPVKFAIGAHCQRYTVQMVLQE